MYHLTITEDDCHAYYRLNAFLFLKTLSFSDHTRTPSMQHSKYFHL